MFKSTCNFEQLSLKQTVKDSQTLILSLYVLEIYVVKNLILDHVISDHMLYKAN